MLLPIAFALSLLQTPQPAPTGAPFAATTPARQVAPPRLRIEPAGRVDLGSIGPKEKKERLYTLRNLSQLPITLRVLDLSPGVTVQGPALQGMIAPGGAAELVLRVDPAGFSGWQTRNVKLGTDDPNQGEYFLPVAMSIRADISADASKKTYGEVAPHETPQTSFIFRSETGEGTKLWISSPLPPHLQAEVEPIPPHPSLETPGAKPPPGWPETFGAVRLTLRPALIEPGVHTGLESITVETSSVSQPKFQFYLDWRLRLPVKLSAPRVVFLDAGESEKILTIQAKEAGKPFVVKALRLEGKGFRISAVEAGPKMEIQVVIHRRATTPAKALLMLDLEGESSPLVVPLSYLPPVKGAPQKLRLDPSAPSPATHQHSN